LRPNDAKYQQGLQKVLKVATIITIAATFTTFANLADTLHLLAATFAVYCLYFFSQMFKSAFLHFLKCLLFQKQSKNCDFLK